MRRIWIYVYSYSIINIVKKGLMSIVEVCVPCEDKTILKLIMSMYGYAGKVCVYVYRHNTID